MSSMQEAMTWDGFWVPHLISWVGTLIFGGVLGTIIAYFVRRNLRRILDPQTDSIDEMKVRMDNLLTALLTQKTQERAIAEHEKRLKAVEQYAADHETAQARRARVEADTRLMPVQDATTTGGLRFRDIG